MPRSPMPSLSLTGQAEPEALSTVKVDDWHVDTARTDNEGHYHIDAWTLSSPMIGITDNLDAPGIWAYKRGYLAIDDGHRLMRDVVWMRPFTGTTDERMNELWLLVGGSSCGGIGIDSEKNLYRLYAPILDEAQSIATTPEHLAISSRIEKWTTEALVNHDRPTTYDLRNNIINANPSDSYKKEDLLK
jgi:hypothetical protein